MTPRVKLLLIGLLVVVVVYQFGGTVVDMVIGPLNALETRSRMLADEIDKKEATKLQIARANRNLKNWKTQSLPPDRLVAGPLYQAWLIELAEKHKLAQVTVSTRGEGKAKADTYSPVMASVKAEGTMKQLCDFLYDFHSSGLLHRVNSITASTTKHQGDPTLDVTINVEGLAMLGAEPRTTLMSKDLVQVALRDRKDYDTLATKNLFVRGYNGPPPPPRPPTPPPQPAPPTPQPPPFDPSEYTRLIASLWLEGQRAAWLYDQSSNVRTDLTEGARFKVANLEGQVLAIADEYIQLQIGGDTFQMDLGQNLKEMRKIVTAPAEPAPMPTASPPASPTVPTAATETNAARTDADQTEQPMENATPVKTAPE